MCKINDDCFPKPDYSGYPAYCLYSDGFSDSYWIAIEGKDSWFDEPIEKDPIQDSVIELLGDINVIYYESGKILATITGKINGQNVIAEMWGISAEWVTYYANKGSIVSIDIYQSEVVESVQVIQAKIKLI